MSAELEWDPSVRLVDRLLEEQRQITAVDDFSAAHASLAPDVARYEALIPTGPPGEGEQYAFRVDLDACTGCKACVTACHSLNGLDEDESWRRVGLLDSTEARPTTRQQTVTGACHHCAEPACLAGCPVRAYEKDATTGIVRHLDDQCIGCRYCQLMCPYDVPQYSERLGIVRKCDMCHGRLAEGEAPACVQGCPNGAISIALVPVAAEPEAPGARMDAASLLPVVPGAMPPSGWTAPTTRYVSARPRPAPLDPVDVDAVAPRENHAPLAVMLVLSQTAIGGIAVDAALAATSASTGYGALAGVVTTSLAAALGLAGLAASFLHLGRPQWAFRVFLGLGTSWMSREIVVLGGFAGAMLASCGAAWVVALGSGAGAAFEGTALGALLAFVASARVPIALGATGAGVAGLLCSAMLYVATRRPLWRFDRTVLRFGGTALGSGLALGHLGLAVGAAASGGVGTGAVILLALALVAVTTLRLRLEAGRLVSADTAVERIALERTRALLDGPLAPLANARRRALNGAGRVLPVAAFLVAWAFPGSWLGVAIASAILVGVVASDVVERSLFFRAEAMPSMPGAG